jgi:hypothetical protein
MTIESQIFHGIKLAQNAVVENFHVEVLTSDPVPVLPGRAWYSETDKVWKQSTLDANGAVVVETFLTEEALASRLSAIAGEFSDEIAARQAADADLQQQLDTEVSTRTSQVASLTSDLAAEVAARGVSETEIRGLISDEVAAREAAIITSNAALAAEAVLARQNESALGVRIDNVLANVDPAAIDSLSELLAAMNSGDQSLTDMIGALSSDTLAAIQQEIADRTAADLVLQGNIDAEAATRATAISNVNAALAQEILDRQAAITAVQDDLTQEVADRIAGDEALDTRLTTVEGQVNGKIGDLSALSTDEKGTVVGAINEVLADVNAEAQARIAAVSNEASLRDAADVAEAQARSAADALIRTDYNDRRKTFESSAPATEHTFVHGLGTKFVSIDVWVKRVDGTYHNDSLPVKVVDNNTVKAFCSFAQDVLMLAESFVAL